MIPLIVKKAFSPRFPYVKIEIDFSAWPRLPCVKGAVSEAD